MLENVHLAPGWLMQLEKKLHSMQPHASFRLFLTMEINPKVKDINQKNCFNINTTNFLTSIPVKFSPSILCSSIVIYRFPSRFLWICSALVASSCLSLLLVSRPTCSGPSVAFLWPACARLTDKNAKDIYTFQKFKCIQVAWFNSACFLRLPTSVLVSTSCWPGSMQSSKNVCVTHHWDGPRNTSLESLTSAQPAIP